MDPSYTFPSGSLSATVTKSLPGDTAVTAPWSVPPSAIHPLGQQLLENNDGVITRFERPAPNSTWGAVSGP